MLYKQILSISYNIFYININLISNHYINDPDIMTKVTLIQRFQKSNEIKYFFIGLTLESKPEKIEMK